jgi:long-chain acyl-CoA synthetase
MTYGQLDSRSNKASRALIAAGIAPQDRVAFLDKNAPQYFEMLFGCAKANAVMVAVNWRLAPPEMAHIINDAEAKVLVVGAELVPQLEKLEPDLRTVRVIVTTGDHVTYQAYDSWLSQEEDSDPRVPAAPGDVAMQLYTSGTTGLPKGAMLTNENFSCLVPHAAERWGFEEGSVNLVAMPLFHIGGSGWGIVGLLNGGHSILMREVVPAEILDAIPRFGITHAFLVPAVLQFLLLSPACESTDFSSLRVIVYGASPISTDVLMRSLAAFNCSFIQVYGLTETTGAITELPWEEHDPHGPGAGRLRSCGKPYEWVELRIVDPDTGADAGRGEVGELWTRSRQNMKGYWNMPEATAGTIDSDGWLRTGDAGYLDADGYVYLHDRIKDMIISAGENIYPAEVENALADHPAVADVAVIGVPDDIWGEAVKALVVRAHGSEVTPEELIRFGRERLAGFKCPKSVDFVESLPRNPSGKILKRELREPYWLGVERQIQ